MIWVWAVWVRKLGNPQCVLKLPKAGDRPSLSREAGESQALKWRESWKMLEVGHVPVGILEDIGGTLWWTNSLPLKMAIYSGFSHEKWWIFPLLWDSSPEGIPESSFSPLLPISAGKPAAASTALGPRPKGLVSFQEKVCEPSGTVGWNMMEIYVLNIWEPTVPT